MRKLPGLLPVLFAEGLLQQQIQARHVDAAGIGIGQVHRHVGRGRHPNPAAIAIVDPQRQGHAIHADPVQRPGQGRTVVGDVGQ